MTETGCNYTGAKRFFSGMSYNERPILERAFELARTGEFISLKILEKALAKEGYAKGDAQIQSPTVRKQLRTICRTAHDPTPAVDTFFAAELPGQGTLIGQPAA